eukprot:7477247-Ditylum_brightwellii.AAC.1
MTEQYSPVGGIDTTDVLAKIVLNRIMDVTDAEAELVEKYKLFQNDSNGVATNLTGLLSGISVTTSSNSVGSTLNKILGEDFLLPMSQPMSDEMKLSLASVHNPTVNQYLLSPTLVDKKLSPKEKKDDMGLVDELQCYDVVDTLEI